MAYDSPDIRREQYLEKPLPSSPDTERTILGAILVDETVLPQAIEHLKPEHFYSGTHRKVYAAMLELFNRREKIDPLAIGEEIKRTHSFETIGGVATISNLTLGLPRMSEIGPHVKTVKDLSQVRDLIKSCGEIISTALAEEDLPEKVLSYAQSKINEVCTREEKKGFVSIGKTSESSLARVIELKKNGVSHTGLITGFRDFDVMTGGLQKTDLWIIAGRPSMGKSSLVANIAERVCFNQTGAVVAVFTLEMSKEQYTDRILCSSAKVDANRMRGGFVTEEEIDRLAFQQNIISGYTIELDDSSSLTPLEMRSKLMKLEVEFKKVDLVIVDYLQRMSASKRTESRQQEVSHIARDLKTIAKDFKVPVVAVSSLSRAPEARNPPKPIMSDLRESGDIESEADGVAFVYREEYYKLTEENAGRADLLVSKHRHGPTGTVPLAFLKEYTKFENYYGD